MEFISAPVLSPTNEVGAIVMKRDNRYLLMKIDLSTNSMICVAEETVPISNVTWVQDQLVYVVLCGETKQVVVHAPTRKQLTASDVHVCKLYAYADELWVQLATKDIAQLNPQTGELTTYVTTNDELLAVDATQLIVYREQEQTLYRVERETKRFTALQEGCRGVQSATLSMTGQYVAYVAQDAAGVASVYVYDQAMQIVQNMTEMFDAAVGGETQLEEAKVMWTETDAFYFVVTDLDEVRLYYGDLYGTLLPASGEDAPVRGYATAKSGNWALLVLHVQQQDKLIVFDITTGAAQGVYEHLAK